MKTKSPIDAWPSNPKSSVRLPLSPSPSLVGSVPVVRVIKLLLISPATRFTPLLSLSKSLSGVVPDAIAAPVTYPLGITTPTIYFPEERLENPYNPFSVVVVAMAAPSGTLSPLLSSYKFTVAFETPGSSVSFSPF